MNILSSIRSRLTFGSLALTLIPVFVVGAILLNLALARSQAALNERSNLQLQSVSEVKRNEVQAYVENLRSLLLQLASSPDVIQAAEQMTLGLNSARNTLPVPIEQARATLKKWYTESFLPKYSEKSGQTSIDVNAIVDQLSDDTVALQYMYVATNAEENRSLLIDAGDNTVYTNAHRNFQPFGLRVLEQSKLYDLLMTDAKGNMIYNVSKEVDFGTDLINGPLKDSSISESVRKVLAANDRETVWLSDFVSYYPSNGDFAAFIAVPIESGGQIVGTLIGQLPIDQVNKIMTYNRDWKSAGLGESGESYLVAADKSPRSVSRFLLENERDFMDALKGVGVGEAARLEIAARESNVKLMQIDTFGVNQALAGKTGVSSYPDYRQVPVLGYYTPVQLLNQRWAMLSEIDVSEAQAPVTNLRKQLIKYALFLVLGLAVIGALAAFALSNSINKPLSRFSGVVAKIAGGDTEARVKSASRDEIGDLARAFDGLLDERVATFRAAERENEQLNNSVIEIMMAVGQLAQRDLTIKVPVTQDVTGAVSDAINLFTNETSNALKQVLGISANVAQASSRVKARSDEVMLVAERSGQEAQAASQELATAAQAINQIAEQAQRADAGAALAIAATQSALDIVRSTVDGISISRDQIRETEKRIKRLGERSQEISGIVNIINQIAERTSVLALNASMQAVAAGDAGRGFAVVADEVKRLAENARQATQQISGLVNAIQADSTETMQAMNQTIAQVVDISKLAERAGEQMNQTRTATDTLVQTVREISVTTKQQSQVSGVLLERAHSLEASNKTTLEQLDQQNKETLSLLQYAKNLLDTVRVFKLAS